MSHSCALGLYEDLKNISQRKQKSNEDERPNHDSAVQRSER